MMRSIFYRRILAYDSNSAFVKFKILLKLFEVYRLTCIDNVFYDASVLILEITLLFELFHATDFL